MTKRRYLDRLVTLDINGFIVTARIVDIEFEGDLGPMFLIETKNKNRFWLTREELREVEIAG